MSTAAIPVALAYRTTEPTTPHLIPQPRGGALNSGGTPGNKGGHGGSQPSEIRKALRLSFRDRLPVLEQLADNPLTGANERIRAVDVLGKYGLGERAELTVVHPDVIAKLQETVALIAGREEWRSEELITALGEIWR